MLQEQYTELLSDCAFHMMLYTIIYSIYTDCIQYI